MKGETDGVALLTQYNDHGIFIALEELGYLLMSISILCSSLVFSKENRLELAIRLTFLLPLILSVIFLVIFTVRFGLDRSYRFEIAIITVNWIALVVAGILTGVLYKKQLKMKRLQ